MWLDKHRFLLINTNNHDVVKSTSKTLAFAVAAVPVLPAPTLTMYCHALFFAYSFHAFAHSKMSPSIQTLTFTPQDLLLKQLPPSTFHCEPTSTFPDLKLLFSEEYSGPLSGTSFF